MCWIETPWLGWSVVRDNTFLEGGEAECIVWILGSWQSCKCCANGRWGEERD